MTATSHSLKREVNDLVLEQVHALKQPVKIDDRELLEYHLRHLQIMMLYRELDGHPEEWHPSPIGFVRLDHANLHGRRLRAMRDRVPDYHEREQVYRLPSVVGGSGYVWVEVRRLRGCTVLSQERPETVRSIDTRLYPGVRGTR